MATISNSKLFSSLRAYTHTLSFKLAAIISVIIFIVVAVVNVYPLMSTQALIVDSVRGDMLQTANIVASSLSGVSLLESSRIESVMDILDLSDFERVLVTDIYGTVIYDSSPYANRTSSRLLLPELVSALSGQDSFRCKFIDSSFESVACVPLFSADNLCGAVCLYENDSHQASILLSMQKNIRLMTVFLLFITLAVTLVFTLIMRIRMKKISAAIGQLREGNYSHRIDVYSNDEVGEIAREFDELSGRLENTENLRRQFVSNASHELKTPLASIKLLTDSILQTDGMEMDEVRDFLGDVSEEISRLTRITDRLLTLTRLDVDIHSKYQPVNIGDITSRATRMLTPLAESRNITINCGTTDDCIVLAEEDGMYQVIFNLMENAIKYNREGGDIRVISYVRDSLVYCIIDDTGIGIPEQELDKIFDRFYRVDKARARATGGTGLGLSIVRTTIEQYGGKVWAQRREPEGTRFTFTVPAVEAGDYED